METDRSNICGCKGIRTCLKCETLFNITPKYSSPLSLIECGFVYCNSCDRCWRGWNSVNHAKHNGVSVHIDGIHVIENFLSYEEETRLIDDLSILPWEPSQSGRRKQNFGPKCNFKKRKLRLGNFNGFPECAKFIHDKFRQIDLLKDFYSIEQCTLEYDPKRGASIDPHIDDCWIWGERIITVNLLADTILTLTKFDCTNNNTRYNHEFAPDKFKTDTNFSTSDVIRIPLPKRSLIVLTGEARYAWLHQIYREDIVSRRLCLAFREFTSPYLPGGEHFKEGKLILEMSKKFWNYSS